MVVVKLRDYTRGTALHLSTQYQYCIHQSACQEWGIMENFPLHYMGAADVIMNSISKYFTAGYGPVL